MTEEEAINEIIATPKYYIGVLPQSTASLFLKRWRNGIVKPKTVQAFIEKFGYVIESKSKISYKKVE